MGCQQKNKPQRKNAKKHGCLWKGIQNHAAFSGLERLSSSWVITEGGQEEARKAEERVGRCSAGLVNVNHMHLQSSKLVLNPARRTQENGEPTS